MKRKIRLLIVDDHAIVRQGLVSILEFQPDFKVVGEAEDGAEAIIRASESKPDVIIMDMMMPILDGAEATARIRQTDKTVKIILLTSFGNSSDISLALENGANGAISKTSPKDELFQCIRDVAAGKRIISSEIQQAMMSNGGDNALSDRQIEILQSLSRGLTNSDIAKQVGLTTAGIKFHLLAIFRKLGAANRSEAVAIALRKHLLKI